MNEQKKIIKISKKILKEYLKGELVWDSDKQGTYVKLKHGKLKTKREKDEQ